GDVDVSAIVRSSGLESPTEYLAVEVLSTLDVRRRQIDPARRAQWRVDTGGHDDLLVVSRDPGAGFADIDCRRFKNSSRMSAISQAGANTVTNLSNDSRMSPFRAAATIMPIGPNSAGPPRCTSKLTTESSPF